MAAIEQIRVGLDNFSYIVCCPISKKAAIVDPGYDASKTLEFTSSKNLELEHVINTHYHSDHSSENKRVKNLHPLAKIVPQRPMGRNWA
ncbi:Zn-dependent hydrolase, glyoxylase [Thermoplasmatales archaeon SCGC AB-539-C06]|nr:Zn-dependent hydrolase, glyoxylase [Thermoplasmatales archaeon SCGC AB-539-C06]